MRSQMPQIGGVLAAEGLEKGLGLQGFGEGGPWLALERREAIRLWSYFELVAF